VDAVTYSPDRRLLTIASKLGSRIQIWDPASQRLRTTVNLTLPGGSYAGGSAIAYSPNGRVLAVGGGLGTVLWDTQVGVA
jgi:WD40 repeat protein